MPFNFINRYVIFGSVARVTAYQVSMGLNPDLPFFTLRYNYFLLCAHFIYTGCIAFHANFFSLYVLKASTCILASCMWLYSLMTAAFKDSDDNV